MIIILEGPDGAGKTTLARELHEWLKGDVPPYVSIHHEGPPPKGVRLLEHYGALIQNHRDEDIIFDRLALGELIYGPVLRGEDRLGKMGWHVFKRLLTAVNALHVICLPPYVVCATNWSHRHLEGQELVQRELQYRDIWTRYHGFAGNAAQHYSVTYDYTQPHALNGLKELIRLKSHLRPLQPHIIGAPGARYLLVGDRGADPHCQVDLPFFATEGSSLYLHETLARVIPERALTMMNAYASDGTMNAIPDISTEGGRIVALGRNAGKACKRQGIEEFTEVPHPQWWRRFRHHRMDEYALKIRGPL